MATASARHRSRAAGFTPTSCRRAKPCRAWFFAASPGFCRGRGVSVARPSPLCQRNQFGPVFEMQAVEMIPPATPDEAVAFEDLDDLLRDLIAPNDRAVGSLRPQPVIAELRIDVDGCAEGVHRKPIGGGDRPAIIDARCRDKILTHLGGDRIQMR